MYGMAASLDPVDAPEPAQLTFSTWPVYDTLIRVASNSSYEPMLASSWEFSEDGSTLELTLRDDVTFSDGEPFDAEAVKANLDRYMAADKTAVQANLMAVKDVEVTGEHEVAVHLNAPTTEILSTLSSNLGGIMISPKALKGGNLATEPVGTGAYTIESFKPSEQAVYVRRDDEGGIWDEETGNVARVEITKIASPEAKVNALKSGQIDLTTWDGNPNEYAGQQVQTLPLHGVLNMVGMYFNPKVKPLDDPKVRQAINMAIDRDAIVAAFVPEDAPRVQPWPEGLTGFDEAREDAYPYDPEAAKALLAEAGYADGITIEGDFLMSPNSNIDKGAETVQAQLAEVGIDIKLRSTDILAQITAYASGGGHPGQFMYMSLPSIDPYSWLQRLFVNPVWVPGGADADMLAAIEGTNDPTLSDDERAAKVSAAIDIATEKALYAPLWQGVGGLAASNKVDGLEELASTNGGVANLRYVSVLK
jgi:peptide/nickel transport system substrate-binding protein